MIRSTPPPDFRYVGLEPGPSPAAVKAISTGAGAAVFGAGIAVGGVDAASLGVSSALGAFTWWTTARRMQPRQPAATPRSMAIVPWGVLVHGEEQARVLRWAAVQGIDVDFVHEMDHATPTTRWSIVTVDTGGERYGGRVPGTASLERLQVHLESYASEASSTVALDVDGRVAADEVGLQPVFEQVLAEARRLLHTGEIAERLTMVASGYRQAPAPTPQTVAELRLLLQGSMDTTADPRPLAAVIAAELEATDLLSDTAKLATSPHPLVAAVSRAAALKLGGNVRQIGAVTEVSEFLPERDLEQIETWQHEARPSWTPLRSSGRRNMPRAATA